MKANLLFDFIVNKDANTLIVKREFDAPLHLVWDAYTKSELLDQWWAPKPWMARTKRMDFCSGGSWLYAMVGPQGEEHWGLVNFKTIQHHRFFTAKDSFCDEEGVINTTLPEADWRIEFTEKGGITTVENIVVYPNLEALETIIKMGMKEGLTLALEGLEDLLKQIHTK